MMRLWTVVTIGFVLAVPGIAHTQQKLSIPSVTPASLTALLHHDAAPTTVTGELYLPPKASGPVPALVLLHGSGGLEGPTGTNIRKWAGTFAGWGIAALVVDSFGPRGIKETGSNQGQLSGSADDADGLSRGLYLLVDQIREGDLVLLGLLIDIDQGGAQIAGRDPGLAQDRRRRLPGRAHRPRRRARSRRSVVGSARRAAARA